MKTTLVLHGGRADIWRDTDVMGRPLGYVALSSGPATSMRAWPLVKYAVKLWFYERWPLMFRAPPTLEVMEVY